MYKRLTKNCSQGLTARALRTVRSVTKIEMTKSRIAVAVVMLAISFALLLAIGGLRFLATRHERA